MRDSIRGRKKKKEKLNLIPIMDAVFIFIFFLLMSAQFIDIYEIESDAPSVVTIDKKISNDKPLNLILEITRQNITVKSGLNENSIKKFNKNSEGKYDFDSLNTSLTEIKLKNIDENSVIFRPNSDVPYEDLIQIMDFAMKVKGEKIISATNKKGEIVKTNFLFDKIIFETII